MTKAEFLEELRKGLNGLPKDDIDERLSFYDEMIDDIVEEGSTEEEATDSIGNVDIVIRQILSDTSIAKLVKERVKPKRTVKAWEIVLIVLGSPIWLSLLIALAAVVLSVYVVLWSVVISLWAVQVSVAVCSVAAILASAVIMIYRGNFITGLAGIGVGICMIGISILMAIGCKYFTKWIVLLTAKFALWIKTLFVGRRRSNV